MIRLRLMPAPLLRAIAFVCLLSLTLAACGFKLRGAFELPQGLQKIYLVGSSNSALMTDLREMLAYSAQVVNNREEAEAILSIDDESSETRTLSVDSRGKVRESEIEYSVTYSLVTNDGLNVIDKRTLVLVRDYINDENNIIGRTNESNVIARDLKRDTAQQILRQIQAVNLENIEQ